MTSVVLVVGLLESDSGKTTASIPLVSALDLVPFKPRSGHNVWLHYDHTRKCVELGIPVSRDVTRLLDAAGEDLPPTLVNPFHRVWTTPDVAKAVESEMSLRYVSSRPDAYVLFDRLGDTVRLYGSDADLRYLPEEATQMLENCDRIEEHAEEPSPKEIYRVIDRAWRKIRREGPVLVESLNNLAAPWPGVLKEQGVVVAVGPGTALLYDLRDYARAVETMASGREPVTLSVLEVLEPIEVVRLPPLSREERTDPRKLEESYEALVEAVEDAL